jgi:hypothetical protein
MKISSIYVIGKNYLSLDGRLRAKVAASCYCLRRKAEVGKKEDPPRILLSLTDKNLYVLG